METITLTPIAPLPKPKPTYYIDASLLKHASCMREVIWTTVKGYSGVNWNTNYVAGYGSAIHRALEYYYSLQPEQRNEGLLDAITKAQEYYQPFVPYISAEAKEFRTTDHLTQTLIEYHTLYGGHDAIIPVKLGGETGLLETRFHHPWFSCADFDIVLVGTIDMIGEYYGELCIIDHKTTSAWDIKKYLKSYKRNIQFQFYTYIFEQLSGKRLKTLINGIFLKKPTKKAGDAGRFDGVVLHRNEVIEYNDEQQEEFVSWLRVTLEKIKGIIIMLHEGKSEHDLILPNHAACHQPFGLCKFYDICSLPKSCQEGALNMLQTNPYNPLRFSE